MENLCPFREPLAWYMALPLAYARPCGTRQHALTFRTAKHGIQVQHTFVPHKPRRHVPTKQAGCLRCLTPHNASVQIGDFPLKDMSPQEEMACHRHAGARLCSMATFCVLRAAQLVSGCRTPNQIRKRARKEKMHQRVADALVIRTECSGVPARATGRQGKRKMW